MPELRVPVASPPTKPAKAGFPRLARVRAKVEFDRVFADGRRTSGPLLSLHVLQDQQPARLGLAVSRKVDPEAVGRNRIKRVVRDRFRHLRNALAPGAYVLVARVPAGQADNATLRAAFHQLLQRAGALPVPVMGGTMPAATSSLPPESAALMRRPSPPA